LVACGEQPPHPPTAVIAATPASVCQGDGFETRVRLDGSRSLSRLALVPEPADPDAPPLSYEWSFSGAAHRVEGGEIDGVEVSVSTQGDRPLHVSLTVIEEGGGEATSVHSLPITSALIQRCDDGGCPSGKECVEHGAARVCAPEAECVYDIDCDVCWRCGADARFRPREVVP
jgi:hypothetical protein